MKSTFLWLAATIFSSQLIAQDSTSFRQLDQVIVTANRLQQKQSSTGKMVTVISQETLQRNAGKNLSEIINYQAGVFINGAGNNLGTNPDVYLRGSGLGNTLILLDGVPMNDPSQINNTFDLNMISLGMIERVEILKGAQSTLWGSDAVAGVINIITKKATNNAQHLSSLLSYGSYQTFRGNIGLNGAIGKLSYRLGYDFTNGKGFSTAHDSTGKKDFDQDNFKQKNWQIALGYQFNKNWSLTTSHQFLKYTGGTDAGAFKDDKDNVFDNKNTQNHIDLGYAGAKVQWHLTQSFLKAGRIYTDDSTSVGGFAKYSRGEYNGNTAITETYGNFNLSKKLVLVAGLQYQHQQTSQSYLSISSFGPYQTALGDSAKANNLSWYNSILLKDLAGFDIEAGFRINRHNIYGNNSTYTINPSYHINQQLKLFINLSSAYKIPSLYQLYSEYGNKGLSPEKSTNYELGLAFLDKKGKSSIRLAGFKRDIQDLIVFYTNPSNFASQYINRDQQHDYGFELETHFKLGTKTDWVFNATYVDGEGENKGVKTKNLYRRPNFIINSIFTWQPTTKLTLMPSLRYIGTRLKGTYDAGPEKMPAYTTIDLYMGYAITKRTKCFIDLRNLTNQEYFDVVGYNSKRFNLMAGLTFGF
ncbi:MAG: TonB-dependent receptor [Sediminibacterium sp.]